MGSHLIDGEFQSDKYSGCPRGKVPLSVKDPLAQDLLNEYAERHRLENKHGDPEFADDVQQALRNAGYNSELWCDGWAERAARAEKLVQALERVLSLKTEDLPRIVPTDEKTGEIEVWSDGHAHSYVPTSLANTLEQRIRDLGDRVRELEAANQKLVSDGARFIASWENRCHEQEKLLACATEFTFHGPGGWHRTGRLAANKDGRPDPRWHVDYHGGFLSREDAVAECKDRAAGGPGAPGQTTP